MYRSQKSIVLIVLMFFLGISIFGQTPTGTSLERLQEAATAISQGQLVKAESLLDPILQASPRDADALNLLGVVRAQQHKNIEAEQLFRRALTSSPNHVGAHVNLAQLYSTTGRTREALPILLAAYKLAPERADVNLGLAAIYESSQDYERALQHLRAIHRTEANADYDQLLLKVLLKLNRLDEARALALEFKNSSMADEEARAQFALQLAGGGLVDEALEILGQGRRDSFPIMYATGVINGGAKRYDAADSALSAALILKPDDVQTLRAIARVARARGELEKSLSYLVRARKLAPDVSGVLYDFGATALQMNLYLDALPVFEELHRQYPKEPAYLYALGAARLQNGEKPEAIRLLREYVVARPQDSLGWYLLGAALHQQKQFAEAQRTLEQSLKLKEDPDTQFLLGLSLDELGNRSAAIEVLQRAIAMRPNFAAAYTALGTAYREQEKYGEARATLERAIELNAKDLRATYQLGLVYAKLGNKEAAQKMLSRADELRAKEKEQEVVVYKLVEVP